MFGWFKKNKTVKILIVVDNDAHNPIDYCNKIDVDIKAEIRAACNDLAISYDDLRINSIVEALENNETYWLNAGNNTEFGFQVLTIQL